MVRYPLQRCVGEEEVDLVVARPGRDVADLEAKPRLLAVGRGQHRARAIDADEVQGTQTDKLITNDCKGIERFSPTSRVAIIPLMAGAAQPPSSSP